MSIADKLTTIAENVPKVYEAGQKSMVDETKIIPKTVTGKRYVYVDDVSEIPHDVTISTTGDCGISVCGKNLLNPVFDTQLFVSVAIGSVISNNTSGYSAIVKVTPNTAYTISGVYTGMNSNTIRIAFTEDFPADGVVTVGAREQMVASTYKTFTFTTPSNCNYVLLMTGSSTVYDYTSNELQLEFGTATPYEPYIEPKEYTTQNGTVIVKSLSPYMTVIADSDVDITMNYHKSYGMQMEYDRFWDAYQENGNRTSYRTSFSGYGWSNKLFNPKYNMDNISDAYGMFWNSNINGDLVEILKNLNISLDSSKATQYSQMFTGCKFTRVGVINVTGSNALTSIFSSAVKLKTIDKLILKEDGGLKRLQNTKTIQESIVPIEL